MLTAGLSVAVWGGIVSVALYLLVRAGRGPLFAPVGPIRPSGNGVAVLYSFAVFAFTTSIVQATLSSAGFFRRLYGDGFPGDWPDASANTIRYLWAATFAFPIQAALIVWIVRIQGGTTGLSARGWERNFVAGYLTWLMVTPAAFCVFALANLANAWLTGQPPDKHPLTALGDSGGSREWTLFVVQTVFLAPILEELLFRGILLPWIAQSRRPAPEAPFALPPARRPLAVMAVATIVALVLHVDDVRAAWLAGNRYGAAAHLTPTLFFLALIPFLYLLPRMGRLRRHLRIRSSQHVRAILASSALFAAVHAHVWPSPVPLVVLAVGLGYLYLRTRSLVGPIVVHGMFNAVSALYLLLGGPA
jgi:membrane protease YdiL (CAAX protease family)